MVFTYKYIYFFIEYLKCVLKSNCIWIIRNEKKMIQKKTKVKNASSSPGSTSRSGQVQRRKPSQHQPRKFQMCMEELK